MNVTPSSTARRSTSSAPPGSAGGPQMPGPVIRIAPNPSRRTGRSPPSGYVPLSLTDTTSPSSAEIDTPANHAARPAYPSENGEVALQLVRGDLGPVVQPLGPLVAQEEVEDVLAEGLGDQLGVLHAAHRVGQVVRQVHVPHRPPLVLGEREHLVLG